MLGGNAAMSVPLKFLTRIARVAVRSTFNGALDDVEARETAVLFEIDGCVLSLEAAIYHLPLTWDDAVTHVGRIGCGWRLPTINELDFWCDRDEEWATIKSAILPAMRGGPGERLLGYHYGSRQRGEKQLHIWSSDVMHGYQNFAWSLGIGDATIYGLSKTRPAAVMLVRETNRHPTRTGGSRRS